MNLAKKRKFSLKSVFDFAIKVKDAIRFWNALYPEFFYLGEEITSHKRFAPWKFSWIIPIHLCVLNIFKAMVF